MKFEKAFEKAYAKTPKEFMPKGNDNFPKIMAFLWSMVAESKNVLDDCVYIDNNKRVVSIPLHKSSDVNKTVKNKADKNITEDKGNGGTESND